jgi:hypothetical protein
LSSAITDLKLNNGTRWFRDKVNVCPGFFGTFPEIRLISRNNVFPILSPFLFFRASSVFLIIFFGMEPFLDLVSDFPGEEMATVLRMVQ